MRVLLGVLALALIGSCKRESGLLEAEGWKKNVGADLDGDGTPNDLHWRQGTVRILLSPVLAPTYKDAVVAAVVRLNSITNMFVIETAADVLAGYVEIGGARPPPGTIYVAGDSGTDPAHGSTTVHRMPDGAIVSAEVQLPDAASNSPLAKSIVLHELLHALGLTHDTHDPESIMYPIAGDGKITAGDVALIRKVYGTTKVY